MTALRFDGVNDVVTIPTGMTGNAGTSSYSFRIKSGPSGITLPSTGNAAFIGTGSSTTTSGISVTSAGALRVYTAGTNRYGSADGLIASGVPFDFTVTHAAGGAWDIYNNLTASAVTSGTFTTSTSFSTLSQFGRGNTSTSTYLQGDIELIAVTGLANAETWNANLSGGTGSVLPTVSTTNQGTLLNFPTDNSQWVNTTGSTPVSFSGPVPLQIATLGTLYSQSLAGYFSGDLTPFTYSVFSGALPTGVTLDSSSGLLSGTPSVQGKFPSIVIRATDTGSNTANSNAFTLSVGAWAVRCGGASPTYLSLYYSYSFTGNFTYEMDIVRRTDVTSAGTTSTLLSNDTDTAGFYFNGQTLVSYDGNVTVNVPHAVGERFVLKLERTSGTLRIYKNNVQIHSQSYGTNPSNLYIVGTGTTTMDVARIVLINGAPNFNALSNLSGGTGNSVPYESSGGGVSVAPSLVNPLASDASWVLIGNLVLASKLLKYHNGTAWVTKPLKYHNGTTWVTKTLKYHNGTAWS